MNQTQTAPAEALADQPITMVYHKKTYIVTRRVGDHQKAPFAWVDGNGLERFLFLAARPFISYIRGRAPQPLYMIFTSTGRVSASFILSQDGSHFVEVR